MTLEQLHELAKEWFPEIDDKRLFHLVLAAYHKGKSDAYAKSMHIERNYYSTAQEPSKNEA